MAYCSVFMFAKTQARKAAAMGRKARSLLHSSASTSMTPARPRPLTTNHDAKNCVSSTKLGAGRRWTASLLTTSISEEQAMYPRVTAAVELELLGLSMLT